MRSDRTSSSVVLEDAGSSYGTYLDGARLAGASLPLRDGARISIGNQELTVDRRRSAAEAGPTIVVAPGRSLVIPPGDEARPRLRTGYALKRLDAAEGPKRWVLKNLRSGGFVQLADRDADLLALFDGSRSLADLVRESEARFGPGGRVRLAGLLTELAERGYLEGAGPTSGPEPEARGWRRAVKPRQWQWNGAGEAFERLYRGGGSVLFTRPALIVIATLAIVSVGVFAYLIAGRYGTPFVVAQRVGLGGLVFILGRLAIAALHETAHGLTMASIGRRVQSAGVKLVVVVPYLYVDTSDVWFEPRRRRIAVSAAGPVSDFALAGCFSICCLLAPVGTSRDIFFQLALAAYVGGLFNLNPFVERDGYHILVDVLREPGLRRRAREQLARRLRGKKGEAADSKVLARYSLLGLAWAALAGCFAIALSLRYAHLLARVAPAPVVWGGLALVWGIFLLAALAIVTKRFRQRAAPEGHRDDAA